jgi:hypothetical protein
MDNKMSNPFEALDEQLNRVETLLSSFYMFAKRITSCDFDRGKYWRNYGKTHDRHFIE